MAEDCHYHNSLRHYKYPMCFFKQKQTKQKLKRAAKGKSSKGEGKDTVKDEIIVQRMSADVTGKQRKYSRIGAREYVPFDYEELSFENVVKACEKHFRSKVDKDMACVYETFPNTGLKSVLC